MSAISSPGRAGASQVTSTLSGATSFGGSVTDPGSAN